jgi:flagellar basal body-associated protein FliL
MADKEVKKDESKDKSKDKESSPGKKGAMIGWIITFVVAAICAGGGYGLSGLFAKTEPKDAEEIPGGEVAAEDDWTVEDPANAKPWTHEMQPVVANLDESGSTRMIQVAVVIELSGEMDQLKGTEYVVSKNLYLRDWLMTHLAGLNLTQVASSSSQNIMKAEIKESFNEILFPDSKPLVSRIMFKDYTIQ